MKKELLLIVSFLLIGGLSTSCKKKHDHIYVETITKSTCEQKGYTTYKCTCGYSYIGSYVDELGHDYVSSITSPTCLEDGYTTYTCSRCNKTYTSDTVEAHGHEYIDVITKPTCTSKGYTTHTCKYCSDTTIDSWVEALNHNYVPTVTESTCTKEGYTTYTCSLCGDSYIGDERTPVKNHDYEITVVSPTCEVGGYTNYQCKDCSYSYKGNYTESLGHNEVTKYEYLINQINSNVGKYDQVVYCSACNKELSRETKIGEKPADCQDVYDVSSYYEGYYSPIKTWTNGEDLKEQLKARLRSGYKALNYNWEVNKEADQALDDFESVDLMYSNEYLLKKETSSSSFGWNREHSFCASLMTGLSTSNATKVKGRATDYHNLIAADSSANQSRGNKNYGYANVEESSYKDFTIEEGKEGYKYDSKNFEPGDEDKGRVARAIFYMATMYKDDEVEGSNSSAYKGLKVVEDYVDYDKNNCQFAIGNLSDLLKWNQFDVDRKEYQHNQKVYSYKVNNECQGNRNPFVDYPQLVEYAFGDKKDQPGKLNDLVPTYRTLELDSKDFANYAISSCKRDYYVGNSIKEGDYSAYKVYKDFSYEDYAITAPTSYTFTEEDIGRKQIPLKIEGDVSIPVTFNVESGGVNNCSYQTFEMKPTQGGVLYSIKDSSNVDNEVNINNVDWIINYAQGRIVQFDKIFGTQFGTKSIPCNTVTFTSKNDFIFEGKDNINAIYIKANTGSGTTANINMYVGENEVYSGTLTYNAENSLIYGVNLSTPLKGKVKIEISNTTKAIYIYSIGVNVI